ncbi:hypothetical protein MJ588_11840 [Klebsiella pneumoniae]|nr:hypothetical protein MJ588_11840 [Klebsiella pneumoniae]
MAVVSLPLVLPALPLAYGQFRLAQYAQLDGDWWIDLWGQSNVSGALAILSIQSSCCNRPGASAIPGYPHGCRQNAGLAIQAKIFWLVKLPPMVRPALLALPLAVGFSASMAQYMPTLWLGAGRIHHPDDGGGRPQQRRRGIPMLASSGAGSVAVDQQPMLCPDRSAWPGSQAVTDGHYVIAEQETISP